MRSGDTRLGDLAPDASELAVLASARFFFLSFSEEGAPGWCTAFLHAERFFGQDGAVETMRGVLRVVEALRQSGSTVLRFSNPRCTCCAEVLTPPERHLLLMVRAQRSGQPGRAATEALMLCEGGPTDKLLKAVASLARRLDQMPPDQAPAGRLN